ncbi:MAG: T9SS type A sorting domain-containing protein [Bacteroidetes bacterium]|nr:T9SS type A sorting domain-containing protein [Bacteroidota bacterium]
MEKLRRGLWKFALEFSFIQDVKGFQQNVMVKPRKFFSLCLFTVFALLAGYALAPAQGLVVNEVSNGPAGAQEYFELVVVGPSTNLNCGPVDLRGWIIDDNNGDFSCGACAGTGIAAGHYRFGLNPVWAAIPTGSIIVLYDPAVKNPKVPADDPNDTSPADGVYILPTSHATLDGSTTPCAGGNIPLPLGACGSCTGNATYIGACYTSGFAGTNAGLRNTGDAAQSRRPDGTYFHGISYGDAPSLINGGPDGLFFPIVGTTRYFEFLNTTNDDFRSISNFGSGTVASNGETPGLANSVANAAWIAFLQSPCLLPVTYLRPLEGNAENDRNVLTWTTATEINSAYFDIERTADLSEEFVSIGSVNAIGSQESPASYRYFDMNPGRGKHWYRLKQVDANGQYLHSNVVELTNANGIENALEVWPNPAADQLHIRVNAINANGLQLSDALGRLVWQPSTEFNNTIFETSVDIQDLPQGNYFLQLRTANGIMTKKVSVIHP